HGESASADMTAVNDGRTEVQPVLDGYNPVDVYSMDEAGLFYCLGPSAALSTNEVRGTKISKERILQLLFSPAISGKKFNLSIYFTYAGGSKAWMTSKEFQIWLSDVDHQMQLQEHKIVLLVDNAPSHQVGELELRNVTIHYLPLNTTSHIQPMDTGIIKDFKLHYTKQLVQLYINCAEENKAQTVDLQQALQFVERAWDSVCLTTTVNCWQHVNTMATTVSNAERASEKEKDVALAQLAEL
uniref:DDE-1 domain-containing protein n=1 Tax=Latimeria chalumnae TaxID=7897 RepID=H3AZI6_LATCH